MLKKSLPLLIVAALLMLAVLIFLNPPHSERKPELAQPKLAVEVLPVAPEAYQVLLQSYGTVRPRTETELLPEVAGKIIEISPNFRNGGFFETGEKLLQIDERDYLANVASAQASLIEAEQALVQEQAQVDQAAEDWARLGNSGKPPSLVSREPQLKAAQARVLAAKAVLNTATVNLERTRIIAPYAGRIVQKKVDVGQVVNVNTSLADIYAVDSIEVRLPLKNRDLGYISLPEGYRFSDVQPTFPVVNILSELAHPEQWQGHIVRTEGAIDALSQQLYVIAQIDDPYGEAARDKQPLKIGQYVTAEITGRVIPNALAIPVSAIYQGTYVYIVRNEQLLRRDIQIGWQNSEQALVAEGVEPGDLLVVTPLGQVASGTAVKIINTDPKSDLKPMINFDVSAAEPTGTL